ncbi:ATP-binding protein [Parashewanella curva]|uniref:ATP-binding protein n=1 Tax=Parashewanella curva TaxID=2338552 RepID=A0A3L8PSF8_9GAMM|nr:AAA family ATPase [Parashewanella curva]RLV58296.1 ATP-binding protein [Parashewanella curva]
MLAKLSVKNFRNFEDWFEIDLTTDKSYEFNDHAVSNGKIKHGIIYGKNGHGKSNLGLALLDITCHLTDTIVLSSLKSNYLNARSSSKYAEFKYEFDFDGVKVLYHYAKQVCDETLFEILSIDGKTVIELDRRSSSIATYNLKGSSSLKNDFTGRNISAVKFVNSNALLDDNAVNQAFYKFVEFVDGMLFFRTLNRTKEFHGQPIDSKRISQTILEQGMLKDFESFLNESGVDCKLKQSGAKGEEVIEFDFDGKGIEFSLVASTGTMSLGNFYYWYLKLKAGEISFAYIDEFDAFYHFALSKRIVGLVSDISCQSIITTHNSSLLSNNLLRPDCYFVLDQQCLTPIHKLTNREIRKAHNLEKMYRSGAFDE